MRGTKILMAVLAAGALTFGARVALAASWTSTTSERPAMTASQAVYGIQLHGITGKVIAVNPAGKTLTVKGAVVDGPKNEIVTLNVTNKSDIRHGWFHRNLSNLRVGEDVRIVYQGSARNWVADHVRILDPLVAAMPVEGPDDGRA